MNFADTEIVNGIMGKNGYSPTENIDESSIILINTCSIRENAEERVYQRLNEIRKYKKQNPAIIVGIIGCMAERLKRGIFNKKSVVDLVLGPDEYRKLPSLIDNLIDSGEKGLAVKLSRVETYDDIMPLRKDGITAWLSVMRGCDKFCSFCVVPYTRGRERSRPLEGVVSEVKQLWAEEFKEVTLLGQNVNSYSSGENDFADLLKSCAEAVPEMRIRFTTSHPQDLSMKLIETIAKYDNLCKYIHLPVQSGSNRILELMKRNYTVEHYLNIIDNIKKIIPDVSLSTDIITGFCSETEDDHKMTLNIMKEVQYDGAYMFKYSPREKTKAWELGDDIDEEVKTKRIIEIVELQKGISEEKNSKLLGKEYEIIIEGISKKSDKMLFGRTDGNKTVIMDKNGTKTGEKVTVRINKTNSATLFGEIIHKN
ncbi:MAG: tRNA (N6-isopentenyl adenosine(37)-C2)-methylthiotransferase MiaB [Chlorobi bacterium]|nr:tRNA (N6-isopentenyl adenosine(37)-C2)-methylthiotransferase MiaB [Chlorobiota bacterium]MCI0715083.1 tRNA (N6-isopentenyl adenosine(37)-C2)-methylthiotransferase MiaB [Chlorobiota bacterium]